MSARKCSTLPSAVLMVHRTASRLQTVSWHIDPAEVCLCSLLETKPEIVSPTDSEWRAFRTSRDQIGAWNWKTNYVDPNVLDGTEWHVIVKYGSKAVESEGANAYPHGKGADPGPAFKKLLTAVSKLLSEREFKCWSNLRPEGTH
jgi:hypothetical protein